MAYLHYLILDLFHEHAVKLSHIQQVDFDLAFNVNSRNSTPQQRMNIVRYFLNKDMIIQSNYEDYLELTKKGGHYWEELFFPNWDLYFEFYLIYDKSDIPVYCFCATKLETVQKFIQSSNGLLDGCRIDVAKNWQPIYWKPQFEGFCIKIRGGNEQLDEQLVKFTTKLPNFKKSLDELSVTTFIQR